MESPPFELAQLPIRDLLNYRVSEKIGDSPAANLLQDDFLHQAHRLEPRQHGVGDGGQGGQQAVGDRIGANRQDVNEVAVLG